MFADIELEAFRCMDRTALQGLQIHSRYLRDVVDRHARTLPLRYIHEVDIASGVFDRFRYCVTIRQMETGPENMLAAADEQNREMLFHRINNAFIHRFIPGFRQNDLPFLYYLRANAADLQCQVNALRLTDLEEKIDYALVGFLSEHLQPQTLETLMYRDPRDDYAKLLTHGTLRGRLVHLVYEVYDGSAPDCIIPELFGAGIVETLAMATSVEPRPWIGKFLEMFAADAHETNTIHSVTLLHVRHGEPLPLSHSVDPLGRPRRTDVPVPHSTFIKEWVRKERSCKGRDTTESTIADLFVFENAKAAKKLEVFVWTVEQYMQYHYAFLLQVVDM